MQTTHDPHYYHVMALFDRLATKHGFRPVGRVALPPEHDRRMWRKETPHGRVTVVYDTSPDADMAGLTIRYLRTSAGLSTDKALVVETVALTPEELLEVPPFGAPNVPLSCADAIVESFLGNNLNWRTPALRWEEAKVNLMARAQLLAQETHATHSEQAWFKQMTHIAALCLTPPQ